MTGTGLHLFDTAIGRCGIAWGPRGITAVGLPEANDRVLAARIARRTPDARTARPTDEIVAARDGILALLAGERRTLEEIRLDMDGIGEFEQGVYRVARAIPPGEILTYGDVAERLGDRRMLARAVGQALGRNPFTIVVPCHRVMAANGGTGGFSAHGGVETKLRLLAIEGAVLPQPAKRRADTEADMPRLPFL
jgi:methylated-DNA-[protein]-cysteine S-methyltransferase